MDILEELKHHEEWVERLRKKTNKKTDKKTDSIKLAKLGLHIRTVHILYEQVEALMDVLEQGEKKYAGRWFWRAPLHETEQAALANWITDRHWSSVDDLPGFATAEEARLVVNQKYYDGDSIIFNATRKEFLESKNITEELGVYSDEGKDDENAE